MNKMELITEKLKDVLSPEDLTQFQDDIKGIIDEKVKEKSDLIVEEEKDRLNKLADDYCVKQISEGVDKVKQELIEEYDQKLEELETSLVEKLDKYLEIEITSKISDEAITKVGINEALEPVVKGILGVLEEKYITPDTEGYGLIKESKEKTSELEDKIASLMNEKMELHETAEKASVKCLILEKTLDCTESEKGRIESFFEEKSFEDVHKNIDSFVELVKEQHDSPSDDTENLNEASKEAYTDDDGIADEPVNLSEKDEEESQDSQYEAANRFL